MQFAYRAIDSSRAHSLRHCSLDSIRLPLYEPMIDSTTHKKFVGVSNEPNSIRGNIPRMHSRKITEKPDVKIRILVETPTREAKYVTTTEDKVLSFFVRLAFGNLINSDVMHDLIDNERGSSYHAIVIRRKFHDFRFGGPNFAAVVVGHHETKQSILDWVVSRFAKG